METWDAITARRNVRDFEDRPDARGRPRAHPRGGLAGSVGQQLAAVGFRRGDRSRPAAGALRGLAGRRPHRALRPQPSRSSSPTSRSSGCARLHAFDLGQASLQMMVVAADLGIGSGHSSVGDQDLARRVLGLPDDKIVGIIIDFGYPADRPLKPIRKPRSAAVRRGHPPRPLVINCGGSNNFDQVEIIRPALSSRCRRGLPTPVMDQRRTRPRRSRREGRRAARTARARSRSSAPPGRSRRARPS